MNRHLSSQGKPVRVLIADDSRLMRHVLETALNPQSGIEIVGTAGDAQTLQLALRKFRPDVVTLDVNMPGEDGISMLARLAPELRKKFVVVSGVTRPGLDLSLRALELGAFGFLSKPDASGSANLQEFRDQLADLVLSAGSAAAETHPKTPVKHADAVDNPILAGCPLLIGASTGGLPLIRQIVASLKGNHPPVAVVQHIQRQFVPRMAARLRQISSTEVVVVDARTEFAARRVHIAPPQSELAFHEGWVSPVDGNPLNFHRPSADGLFASAARAFGSGCTGLLLSGMGRDGAAGMRVLHAGGASTIAQGPKTCTVFGMPRAAIEEGSISHVLEASEILRAVERWCEESDERLGFE